MTPVETCTPPKGVRGGEEDSPVDCLPPERPERKRSAGLASQTFRLSDSVASSGLPMG